MSDAKPTPEERLAAVQARRDAQRSAEGEAFAEQQATDMEALADLEAEHGFDRVQSVTLIGWTPNKGAATMIAVRVPLKSESYFKRYLTQVSKPKPDLAAAWELLGESCLIYPSKKTSPELYANTMELAPGALARAGTLIVHVVEGKADEEKKG